MRWGRIKEKAPRIRELAGLCHRLLAETEAAKLDPKPIQFHPNIFQQFKDLHYPSIQFTLAPSNPIQRFLMG
jgi:hypothetical protein